MVRFLAGLILGILIGHFEWDMLVRGWALAREKAKAVYLWVRTKRTKKK